MLDGLGHNVDGDDDADAFAVASIDDDDVKDDGGCYVSADYSANAVASKRRRL